MAKIIQDNIVITVSKIARDGDGEGSFVSEDTRQQIETIVTEVLGDGFVVDVLS